jgi:hypothetical protein
MDFREIGCEGLEWIELAQLKEKLRAPLKKIINFPVPCKTGGSLY